MITVSAMSSADHDTIIVSLSLENERYVWAGQLSDLRQLRRSVGESAANALLKMNWVDATIVHDHLRTHLSVAVKSDTKFTLNSYGVKWEQYD